MSVPSSVQSSCTAEPQGGRLLALSQLLTSQIAAVWYSVLGCSGAKEVFCSSGQPQSPGDSVCLGLLTVSVLSVSGN